MAWTDSLLRELCLGLVGGRVWCSSWAWGGTRWRLEVEAPSDQFNKMIPN